MKYEIKTKYVNEGGEPFGDVIIIDDVDFVDYETLQDFVQFRKKDLNKQGGGIVLLAINRYDVRSIRLLDNPNKSG